MTNLDWSRRFLDRVEKRRIPGAATGHQHLLHWLGDEAPVGVADAVGWYRTHFRLDLPAGATMPLGISIPHAADKAVIWVNGWLMGRYWEQRGPQHEFYIPSGVLSEHGDNVVAIAVWNRGDDGGLTSAPTLQAYSRSEDHTLSVVRTAQWRLNLERLEHFVQALRAYPDHRWTFEFRHPSWLVPEVYALLEGVDAALCLPVHPKMPLDLRLTSRWTYIRMHFAQGGWGFSDTELAVWADRIREFRGAGVDVYIYFNNDPGGHALEDARHLKRLLGIPS